MSCLQCACKGLALICTMQSSRDTGIGSAWRREGVREQPQRHLSKSRDRKDWISSSDS